MRLIDVDALCDEIESVEYSGHDPEVERICSLIQKAKWIDAEPKRKTGIWMGSVCSECGNSTSFYYDCDYCPNCGADMRGEE